MSIQTIDGTSWENSSVGAAVRRTLGMLLLVVVVVGPLIMGGALAWILTNEPGPVMSEDGGVWSRSGLSGGAGVPLISKRALEATGLSPEEARAILRP